MRLMPTFRKFKVKWGKSHISTHATRRPACPPHSVCGDQSDWPGSAVDRGSAGEPSGAHSLWQGAEICPPDLFALSPGTWETPYQPPEQQGVAVRPGALRACSFVRPSEARGTTRSRAPAVPVGVGPPTTQTLALDFTWTELTSSVN